MNDQNSTNQNNCQTPPPPPQQGYTQQVIYNIQQPQQPLSASPGEKEALFSTTGSIWMLIASIVVTVNLITGFVSSLITGLINTILTLLMVIGLWITYANGRKKTFSTTGISLISVPYTISFVFLVLSFSFNVLLWIFTFNILNFILGVLVFVFECICYSSVKKSLRMAHRINSNRSVMGMKAGIFAAVVMIITASFKLIKTLYDYFVMKAVIEGISGAIGAGGAEVPEFAQQLISTLFGGGNIVTVIAAVVTFLAAISGAIVLLMFGKKIKEVDG